MKRVLLTGADGQLGSCIMDAAKEFPEIEIIPATRAIFDLTDTAGMRLFLKKNTFDFCVNAAAYTQVDQAENETQLAFQINAEAVRELALLCREFEITLLHISTDYVFNGQGNSPYTETDPTDPIGVYGASKRLGEQHIEELLEAYYIIRTSWLYSQYGHNFLNTILKHTRAGRQLSITTEQQGVPTNANDLARALLQIALSENKAYGIYHFSNSGSATWYDFARAILKKFPDLDPELIQATDHYPTLAKRPDYSILKTSKLESTFGIVPLSWEDSLTKVIDKVN